MSDSGVSDYDMPNFPWPPRRDVSGIPDAALSALLAGTAYPVDATVPLQHVADVLAALRAEPRSDELAGKAAALADYRRLVGVSVQSSRSRRRRRPVLTSLLSGKAAAAVAVTVVGLGGAATAAYAGALPASVQQFAHDTIGAPAKHGSDQNSNSHGGKAVGPNASGHAAFGLCTAYAHASKHGTATQKAVAFRNLAKAAGGASNIAAYCAAVPHPGASHAPSSHPTGKPSGLPSHPTGKPSGLPSHPTGKPSGLPSHPTGKPSNS